MTAIDDLMGIVVVMSVVNMVNSNIQRTNNAELAHPPSMISMRPSGTLVASFT